MDRRFSRPRFEKKDRFERGGWSETPVKEGDTYDVEIKEIGSKGDGIARVKNFVIFVPDVKQGEKCKIKINSVARRFATAEKVGKSEEPKKKLKVEEAEEPKKKLKVEEAEEPKKKLKVEEAEKLEEAEVEAVGED